MQETGIVAGLHQVVNRRYPVDLPELDGTAEAGGYFVRPGFGLSFHQDVRSARCARLGGRSPTSSRRSSATACSRVLRG